MQVTYMYNTMGTSNLSKAYADNNSLMHELRGEFMERAVVNPTCIQQSRARLGTTMLGGFTLQHAAHCVTPILYIIAPLLTSPMRSEHQFLHNT